MACRFATLLIVAFAGAAAAQTRDPLSITTDELGARLRFLSADRFEGRFPGTRGEQLTTAYLISELQSFGVKPGAGGDSWLQPVRIAVHDPVPDAPVEARLSGRVQRGLVNGPDIRLLNNTASASVSAGGELVFVGYGIYAPVYGWDDFAGLDLKDKVVVFLPGEPNVPGDTMRFNGVRASRFSWQTDKIVEMERRGAKGALVLRPPIPGNRVPAGGSRRIEDAAARATLAFTGIITEATLAALMPSSQSVSDLVASAARPGFKAVALGTRLEVAFQTRPRTVATNNVVGVIGGTASARASEHIVFSSHWDAFGIGRAVNGDSIYNGTLDDGSGVTAALALARVFAANPQPRSLTFLFTTAEEWGLLGAEAFVCQGPLALDRVIANLNLDDGIELFGPKRDVAPLGIELSTLGRTVAQVAATKRLRVTPDPFPQEGFFLRADNYPFARAGVPGLYLALGTDGVQHGKAWVEGKVDEYLKRHYHQPSDDYATTVLDLRGAQQFTEFARDVAIALARAPERPEWVRGSEFSRLHERPACR